MREFVRRWRALVVVLASTLTIVTVSTVNAAEKIRAGVLKFGTVNWELNTIKHHGFDSQHGIELEVVPLASGQATKVALLAGDVDVIVSDWLWVSRQRATGRDFTLVPYSSSIGAIMVPPNSDIRDLAGLKGKTIAVAGGPLDKSWLMLQGVAKRNFGFDLKAETEQVFGAPPLLAKKAEQGEVDAVLNFWHYSARLEAKGFRRVMGADDAAAKLGAKGRISAIGYVFSEAWAKDNPDAAMGFVKASTAAKALLKSSDEEWERLREATKAKDAATLIALRDRFREGIPDRPIAEEIADTAEIYRFLAETGGEKLVGPAADMVEGTFWPALTNGS